ncbi:MAG: ribosomal RNA small subunit methyltransferase A [Candidatus Altiarchaeales archaeon]|nr:ribosomal RNA small subunit methyltransferase A [Candidatus Altiarchaeales archaeon]
MASKKDQRLLVDNLILEKIVLHACLKKEDTVLEVGAGNGHLTVELAELAGRVYAVEKSHGLCETLKQRVRHYGNVDVIEGDALKAKLPACNKVVSNLPYSISKKITVRLLEHGFKEAFLLYQKEFAEKLLAKPGQENYRFITVLVQSTCEIKPLMDIPPEAFQPQPKVNSTLVKLTLKARPDRKYIDFLQKLFNHKNKNLRNIVEDCPKQYAEKKPAEMTPEELNVLYREFLTR